MEVGLNRINQGFRTRKIEYKCVLYQSYAFEGFLHTE